MDTDTGTEPHPIEDARPRLALNKSAWRVVSLGSVVLTLSAFAALLAVTTVAPGEDHAQHDVLTTVTLLLAVLAFLIQIFVFVFQTNASTRSVQRSEEINATSNQVLTQIRATNDATQKVLFEQFDRLLDYVVAPGTRTPTPGTEKADEPSTEESASSAEPEPLTAEAMRQILEETSRPPRPTFRPASGEQTATQQQLRNAAPTRAEAEEAVKAMSEMSPGAVAKFAQHVLRALDGKAPYVVSDRGLTASSQALADAGYVDVDGKRIVLTDKGIKASTLLPLPRPRGKEYPDWWAEVVAPII